MTIPAAELSPSLATACTAERAPTIQSLLPNRPPPLRPTTARETWNGFVAEHNGHLLQSWEWGELKERHGWRVERLLVESPSGSAAAQVLYKARGPISAGYIPRGPVITGDANSVWPFLITEIDRSARRQRAIMTVIEPDRELGLAGTFHQAGVVEGPPHVQPGRTVKIPLLDDDSILKQMHQKTRYSVRLAGRRGVTIERVEATGTNLDTFYTLMRDTAERNQFGIHTRSYYEDFLAVMDGNACLIFARVDDGEIGATLISARFGTDAIYMYGASSSVHRSHGAAFLLQFKAMQWGRDLGCTSYDLWGIPDRDPEPNEAANAKSIAGTRGDDWNGLYRFKVGFGGEINRYPPTLERRHLPVLPWVARKLNAVWG